MLYLVFNLEQNLGRRTLEKPETLGEAKYYRCRKKYITVMSEGNILHCAYV